ncbi:RNA polymerase sigma factor [Roseiconus lacunae]|uniref:Sigma-70 family RNA polymerase sigma factor n=1 Tax=Roseiconus lacunae TaxID=2605694 RepID=A0ABT7PNW9_9BACT|nr:sigma-70 family RNA polymerase sigma factor [Roseiconus lacunae]MDM4018205.1 sigma-70 family RNA polymerase sigma factor [Roseiconus lacunae]
MQQTTKHLEALLDRHRNGDPEARQSLINFSCERLHVLAHKMLARNPKVKRWEETDDVLNMAVLKLDRTLENLAPNDVQHFMSLAGMKIRQTLCDLARKHYGKYGIAANHETDAAPGSSDLPARVEVAEDLRNSPDTIAMQADFHEAVDLLPDDQKDVINLSIYIGLEQQEIAEQLGVSVATVKRRKREALTAIGSQLSE